MCSALLWPMCPRSRRRSSRIHTAHGHGRPSRSSAACRSNSATGWRFTFVIVGLRRQIEAREARPRWRSRRSTPRPRAGCPPTRASSCANPPSSTHPAGLAIRRWPSRRDPARVHPAAARGDPARGAADGQRAGAAGRARETGGLDLGRLEVDFGSAAILERFARRPRARPRGRRRRRSSSAAASGSKGSARTSGCARRRSRPREPSRRDGFPGVEAALRRFGPMTTAEVAAVCDLPGPRAPAELWKLALEWRVKPRRVPGGELWEAA